MQKRHSQYAHSPLRAAKRAYACMRPGKHSAPAKAFASRTIHGYNSINIPLLSTAKTLYGCAAAPEKTQKPSGWLYFTKEPLIYCTPGYEDTYLLLTWAR
jgi:hypothetical protein